MGLFGDREKGPPERKARWAYLNLDDFKNRSCWTPVAYVWLWFMAIVSVAVYGVDTFTAVNLLVFDHWSSQVNPVIKFKYSKWIFAICILLSWVLCIIDWVRAIRVIRRDGVASSYMDPLAVSLQSMRGKGFKRFLVFTELTKSKKGADYVAFFVYFAFQGALRVVVCEGPRQVVNAFTLESLFASKLINQAATQDKEAFVQFWLNLKTLANQNLQQVLILGSMLFTLIIWIFSALCLATAGILYLVFLWHYIPQSDGRLSIYCRRKIDRRLEKIVGEKVQDAIEEENRKREKEERRAELKRQKTGELPPLAPPKITRQPTLPQLSESPELRQDDKIPDLSLQRQDTNATVSTLPRYTSQHSISQGSTRQPTLPDLDEDLPRPEMPRNVSNWSQASYESDAPLLSNAGFAGGDDRGGSPAPTYYSRQNSNAASFNRRPIPGRNFSQSTQASQRSYAPMSRMESNGSQRTFSPLGQGPPPPGTRFPVRSNTGFSFEQGPQSIISPISPVDTYGRPLAPPMRSATVDPTPTLGHDRQSSQTSYFSRPVAPPTRPATVDPMPTPGLARQSSQTSYFSRPVAGTAGPGLDRKPTYGSLHSQQSSFSRPLPRNPSEASTFQTSLSPVDTSDQPTPLANSYEMTSQPSYGAPTPGAQGQQGSGGYVAFNPGMHSAATTPASQAQSMPPRAATAPNQDRAASGYGDILDHYGGNEAAQPPPGPQRSYTGGSGWQTRY